MNTELTAWNRLQRTALATDQIRRVDQLAVEEYGMHSLVLMENAGLGCRGWLESRFPNRPRTTILCGRGNNGGDGLVIARHLQVLGWPVSILVWGPIDKLSKDAFANLQILLKSESEETLRIVEVVDAQSENQNTGDTLGLEQLQDAELIVDAMLGTEATGDPREPLASWITAANAQEDAYRLAIDNPTGLDANSGRQFTPAFRPSATLSFVCLKPAMIRDDSRQLFGEIDVLPIGIPYSLIVRILKESDSE